MDRLRALARPLVALVALAGCTATPSPADPAPTSAERVAPAPTPAPLTASAPAPAPAPAEVDALPPAKLAATDRPPLTLAYRDCLGEFTLAEVAGETYVLSGYRATGRIDRLAADGSVAQTYDLPIGADELSYVDELGPDPAAKMPIGALRGLAGRSPRELYVVADLYVAMESWQTHVFALRGRRWVATRSYVRELYPRGDGVLGYTADAWGHRFPFFEVIAGRLRAPSFTPILEVADAAGAGPSTLDETFGPPGIDVVDHDVPRVGSIFAIVRYHDEAGGDAAKPVGTWLMAWSRSGELSAITRITEDFDVDGARVVADGDDAYVLLRGGLQRWRAGALEPLATPPFADAADLGACLAVHGVDPRGRLWLACGRQLAALEGDAWRVETLPGAPGLSALAGVEAGVVTILDGDDALWSRDDEGAWTRTPYADARPQRADVSAPRTRLHVEGSGAPWLIREFFHGDERSAGNLPQRTSYVYTARPLGEPNTCR
ncbi:MAG: hypothetical protein H6710_21810 [Myxococcales bacterium]|nr:hypothetical protein [Myxococcales bacterium]